MFTKKFNLLFAINFLIFFLLCSSVEAKFINTFLYRIGGNNLRPVDKYTVANFDIVFLNKFHYDDIDGDTWGSIKAINPDIKIFLYTTHNTVFSSHDNIQTVYLNDLGRYNISRGHSMGSLNRDHPEFFLKDANGNRITKSGYSDRYVLDFGNSVFQNYSAQATIADHTNSAWTADGVYSDNSWSTVPGDMSALPLKYNTHIKWSNNMNNNLNVMTAGLNLSGQEFACNRGFSNTVEGYTAWMALDNTPNPPDMVLEEAAFAAMYSTGDIYFLLEDQWKRQIDLLGAIRNSKVGFFSSTDLAPDQSGVDNYGKSFTFWDGLWYTLGSYLVGKNDIDDNSYFKYRYQSYNYVNAYYSEYDKINLGRATSTYRISNINGHNIYWREYERGYVYVNPTLYDVNSISLPEPCKQRTHNNLLQDLNNLPNINSISLKSHRAAILYKSNQPSSSSIPPPSSPPANDNSSILLEAEDGDLYSPMRSVTDSNASSGEYIWVSSGNGGYAKYSFYIPEAGTYYIWGRVKGTTAGYNSFYFSVDNGNHVTWNFPVSSNWSWDQAASAYFSAGQHTIKIEQREYRAQLDQLLITKEQNYVPQGSINQTTIEAEAGVLHSPMRSAADSNASSGAYIYSSTNNSGYADYSFNVPKSGTYFIWGRALSPHLAADSFYISIDNGSEIEWHIPIFTNWNWDQAAVASLNAGQHTLNIRQRERNTKLDKILITNDPDNVPNE